MTSYLLNISAIWLLSLLCFDIFLKREPYHGLNRAYLLITLLLGLVVPLFTWPPAAEHIVYVQAIRQPLYTPAARTREAIVQAVATNSGTATSFSFLQMAKYIYYGAALISLLPVLRDAFLLLRYYRNGRRSKENNRCIVETGKAHGPFSFAHIIFVSDKAHYSEAQWNTVLQHETRHGRLFHLADLLLVQILQVVLWFHPLVYLYRRRLLMVHEYQADAIAVAQPEGYGHFLIEQAMLSRAPSLTHSFNCTPVHKRIYMLLHSQTPQMHFMKLLIIIPVITLSFVCCTRKAHNDSVSPAGSYTARKTIHFRNNEIVYTETPLGGVNVGDSTSGKISRIFPHFTQMQTLNGKKIFFCSEIDERPVIAGYESFAAYLFSRIKPDLEQLPDGYYSCFFRELLLDENGRFAYYKLEPGLDVTDKQSSTLSLKAVNGKAVIYTKLSPDLSGPAEVPPGLKKQIDAKLAVALDEAVFTPGKVKGQNVPVELFANDEYATRLYHVQNHVATLEDYEPATGNQDTLRLP